MFVYIDTASAVKSSEFGGRVRFVSCCLRVKLLGRYDLCWIAAIWSLSAAHMPMAWRRLPDQETIGRVVRGVLCTFISR